MKKIFLILLALIIQIQANDMISYKEALRSNDKRPMFIFVTAQDCPYCKETKEQIEKNENFKTYVKENFQFVTINQTNEYTPNHLISKMVPAFYITNSDGDILDGPYLGIQPLDYMLKRLNIFVYKSSKK